VNTRITLATARRVLTQLRRDPRTIALLLVAPCVLMALVEARFAAAQFDRLGAPLLGVIPFVVMFAVTANATLRERTVGTLERLLALPLAKLDLLLGYAVAFSTAALVQVGLVVVLALGPLGLDIAGSTWLLLVIAVLSGLVGVALGLFLSAFATTEYQVGQFMPAVVLPQLLLSGLFGPRDEIVAPLRWLSVAFPLTAVVDALQRVTAGEGLTGAMWRDLAFLVGSGALALTLGAATLRRQTA
jgi:ABC-2 type transport system permease protein